MAQRGDVCQERDGVGPPSVDTGLAQGNEYWRQSRHEANLALGAAEGNVHLDDPPGATHRLNRRWAALA